MHPAAGECTDVSFYHPIFRLVVARALRGELLRRIGHVPRLLGRELKLRERVSQPPIGVVPIVARPRPRELQGQGNHIRHDATLAVRTIPFDLLREETRQYGSLRSRPFVASLRVINDFGVAGSQSVLEKS